MEFFTGGGNGQAPSQFPLTVSSYFRRPSKVVKAGSRNTSPKQQTRKRATSNVAVARTRSVVDRQRASVPQWHQADSSYNRPVSWHSSPYNFGLPFYDYQNTQRVPDLTVSPYIASETNGLVTPVSYPMLDEPQIQEIITPLEELSAHGSDYTGYYGNCDASYWHGQSETKLHPFSFSQPALAPENTPGLWQWNMPSYHERTSTAPVSPEFLPMQDFGEHIVNGDIRKPSEAPVDAEELVGMGLYDSPAQVQSSSLLFGSKSSSLRASIRRSLKLEDSFEPPADSGNQEDPAELVYDQDDASDPDDSDQDGQQVKDEPPTNLLGQSFFFEEMPDVGLFSAMNIGCSRESWPVTATNYSGYTWV